MYYYLEYQTWCDKDKRYSFELSDASYFRDSSDISNIIYSRESSDSGNRRDSRNSRDGIDSSDLL